MDKILCSRLHLNDLELGSFMKDTIIQLSMANVRCTWARNSSSVRLPMMVWCSARTPRFEMTPGCRKMQLLRAACSKSICMNQCRLSSIHRWLKSCTRYEAGYEPFRKTLSSCNCHDSVEKGYIIYTNPFYDVPGFSNLLVKFILPTTIFINHPGFPPFFPCEKPVKESSGIASAQPCLPRTILGTSRRPLSLDDDP